MLLEKWKITLTVRIQELWLFAIYFNNVSLTKILESYEHFFHQNNDWKFYELDLNCSSNSPEVSLDTFRVIIRDITVFGKLKLLILNINYPFTYSIYVLFILTISSVEN